MAKINLPPIVTGSYSNVSLNNRFQQIEDAFNDGVLWRDNPTGEPNEMTNPLDMADNKILNLSDAEFDHEAVNLGQVGQIVRNEVDELIGGLQRTVRTPEDIPALPSAAQRANRLLEFDNEGNPTVAEAGRPNTYPASGITITPVPSLSSDNVQGALSEIAGTLTELSETKVQSVATIADLRALDGVVVGQEFSVSEYAAGTGVGGGDFVARSGSDADDDVVVFESANGVRIWRKNYATLTPEMAGGVPGGNVQTAIDRIIACGKSKSFKFNDGLYEFANADFPAFSSIELNAGTVLQKNANGYLLDLNLQSTIKGPGRINGGQTSGFTGPSIRISRGINTTNLANQGHQRIVDLTFLNSESYHVEYIRPSDTAGSAGGSSAGWMSEILYCKFISKPSNANASVKWPSEPVNGGNRHIIGGFSICPVVDVGHSDNGVIAFVEIGATGAAATGETGILFPPPATIDVGGVPTEVISAKIRVIGCRFAGGTGIAVKVRGNNHTFEGNEANCNIEFTEDSINCVGGPGNDFSSGFNFVDSSGKSQRLVLNTAQFFTPTIQSGATLGDGSLQGEYKRDGAYIWFRIEFTIGSTTNISGAVVFDLPVPVLAGTRRYIGSAWHSGGFTGTSLVRTSSSNDVRVYNSGVPGVWNDTVPKAYASGDVWILEATYRIF